MESLSLIDSFQEFKEFKDIDRATLMNILESVFRSTIKRITSPRKGSVNFKIKPDIYFDQEKYTKDLSVNVQDNIKNVIDGKAHYGIADAGLLLSRYEGKPVVLISQIFPGIRC